jgi:hypothetical protein
MKATFCFLYRNRKSVMQWAVFCFFMYLGYYFLRSTTLWGSFGLGAGGSDFCQQCAHQCHGHQQQPQQQCQSAPPFVQVTEQHVPPISQQNGGPAGIELQNLNPQNALPHKPGGTVVNLRRGDQQQTVRL